jgi:hypothetical protein
MKKAAAVMKKPAMKKNPAKENKPMVAMKARDRKKGPQQGARDRNQGNRDGDVALLREFSRDGDVALLREPYSSFIRELHNSRKRLRSCMHPAH